MSEQNYKMIFTKKESKKFFFTSDTHFGHENIIKFCKRPFDNVDEHDKELIRRWNEVVPEDGIVFHLGDVGFGNPKRLEYILNKLNGKIYLVIGNHDWRGIIKNFKNRFEVMTQQVNMKVGDQHIILNHFPMLCYSGTYHKTNQTWQLFGHVHSSPYYNGGLDAPRLDMLFPIQYDVGVDNNDFRPISYNTLKLKIEQQIINHKIATL